MLFPSYPPDSPNALALAQEIQAMMEKDALEVVDRPSPGFYSRLFLVEKVTGGWRPVIDLSPLHLGIAGPDLADTYLISRWEREVWEG